LKACRFVAETVLLPSGWVDDVLIEVDASGNLAQVTPVGTRDGEPIQRIRGAVLAGMANLHSHASQRCMAGLAERGLRGRDTFWTWREAMYALMRSLRPEDVCAVARQLYIEMLKAGYTAVGEFHYLHNDAGGERYQDRAEVSIAILTAAAAVGIGITHLPVLYRTAGFGGDSPSNGQVRFVLELDEYLRLVESLRRAYAGDPQVRIGVAPHSLRAVSGDVLGELLNGLKDIDPTAPIHIHIAEQRLEVDEAQSHLGDRPVAWLLSSFPVDERWCLVHCIHATNHELKSVAERGATIGVCPTTEANLGDGVFPLVRFLQAGGRFGIGSDSNISVSPVEELRWLEYTQRLKHRRRNVAATASSSTGARLYQEALSGGAAALGRNIGSLRPGHRADLIVLDLDNPLLVGRKGDGLLDAFVFAGNANPVRHVMVGGRWVIQDGRHPLEEPVAADFARVIERLVAPGRASAAAV
jgi:formimidoylglutamate deiminase